MPAPAVSRYAWMVVALLFPVVLLNYLDRQMLATMKASMVADIPSIANRADWGLVLGSFKWVYALLSPVGGYIADRYSRRHVICISLVTWSLVTWLTGHVTSFQQLIAARALMGVSEACYLPAALALITEYHLGNTRSRAVGVHQTGLYFGLILGGYAGHLADAPSFGWRWVFSLGGMIGVAYAIPLFALLRNAPRVASEDLQELDASCGRKPGSAGIPAGESWASVQARRHDADAPRSMGGARESVPPLAAARELVGNPNFILLVLYFTLPAIAGWVVRDWMPDILREKFHLGQGSAGVKAVVYVQVASLIGAVVGGVLADRWMRRSWRGRIRISAIGTFLFLPALFGVGNASALWIAVASLILFGIGWGFFDCNNMPILCQITRPQVRATGYGFMNMVSISCGGFGDWGFGALRDAHVPLNAIFGTFAGVALLSVFIVLRINPTTGSPSPTLKST